MSDVLVGIVAGAVCSVAAAAFEGVVLTARFFTLGHVGGGLEPTLLPIALVGAVAGGAVSVLVGAIFRRDAVSR